jgi:glycosyltransferase involved in cell wall biosynthesis
MRVGLDGRLLLLPLRGMGIYVNRVLQEILSVDHTSEYVLFIDTTYKYNALTKQYEPVLDALRVFPNLEIVDVHAPNEFMWEQICLPRVARRYKLDILHFPANRAPAWRPARKMVATVHDTIEILPEVVGTITTRKSLRMKFYYWRVDLYLKVLFHHIFRRMDLIITDSEHSKLDIERLCDVPLERINVVPLAPKDMFRLLDCAKGDYLLMYGSEAEHKNCARVIRAYAALPASVKQKHPLRIVGRPPALERLVTELGEKQIFFQDSDFGPSMVRTFNQALGFVFASLYEGFGIPPVEAMASGTAVIASSASCIPEIVGDAALLVNPYDEDQIRNAMLTILTDPLRRKTLEEAGLQRARRYSWKHTANRHLDIYRHLAVQTQQ